jgi:predicted transcriptional regulator
MSKHDKEQKQVNIDTALDLRLTGMSYRQIAKAMGVSPTTAFNYVKEAISIIQKEYKEKAEELITIDLAKLSKMEIGLYKKAIKGDKGSIDSMLKIMERRSKLLGLDQPTKSKVDLGFDNIKLPDGKPK